MATRVTPRSWQEHLFCVIFVLSVICFFLIYKYPQWFVAEEQIVDYFYWLGKSTSFWYATVYSGFVCGLSLWVLKRNRSPYSGVKKPLSQYQRRKFLSIFFAQLICFYFVPFILPEFLDNKPFFSDPYKPTDKDAYIYVYNGFLSASGFLYVFVLVPLTVWYFGKRYCSWFCSCGNLAEVVGATPIGNRWVKQYTPRSEGARKLEWLQYAVLCFALFFGAIMLLHGLEIISAPRLVDSLREIQDLSIDLMFGALIGVGAYPFLGTRIWCRYGCPLAGMMRLFGKFSRSRFAVVTHKTCRGFNLCSKQCPMGIDVAKYAHKDRKPLEGEFGLNNSPCIGCGGCVDICPVKALSFKKILNPHNLSPSPQVSKHHKSV
ncbi:MAG: 4Fe-4S binding protein [Proteobacteria bacterium]|nr:4Fe-4S binding protein [Pseudomonadota bacterium]